jgi:HTH-type transcriptional regulator/antitoxin HigA
METLKYTLIKNESQYHLYCDILEKLLVRDLPDNQDEIELLTLIIEKWDEENNSLKQLDPVQLLKHLMLEHQLKAKDLIEILHLSKGTISKILNYQKGFSKESIRNLSIYFRVSQEAFNRPYDIQHENERPEVKVGSRRPRKVKLEVAKF